MVFSEEKKKHGLLSITDFEPQTHFTSQAAIDLDQALLEELLAGASMTSFVTASRVYAEGAFSWPYAELSLANSTPIELFAGMTVTGVNAAGQPVEGAVLEHTRAGTSILKVQYVINEDDPQNYVHCQVGGNPNPVLQDCFAETGNITVVGIAEPIHYTYRPTAGNKNDRSLQRFSTLANRKQKQCSSCEYFKDFDAAVDYYGTPFFADDWIKAAFSGAAVTFTSNEVVEVGTGNAAKAHEFTTDFTEFGYEARAAAIQTATAYWSTPFMVLRELEESFRKCQTDCGKHRCTTAALHTLDTSVAFYTGSLVVTQGNSAAGKLQYSLADKMCRDFMTCGRNGDSVKGTAKVNYDIFAEFEQMQQHVFGDDCPDVRRGKDHIAQTMLVPLIQALLKSTYHRDHYHDTSETERAVGATLAATLLPQVARCSMKDAAVIHHNTELAATTETSFEQVKDALERHYKCMGITCEDVGGYYDHTGLVKGYYKGAAPCVSPDAFEVEPYHYPVGLILLAMLGAALWHIRRKLIARNERLEQWDRDNDLSDSSDDDEMVFT